MRLTSPRYSKSAQRRWWPPKDAFKKAWLGRDKAPTTLPDTLATARRLRAACVPCGLTAAWISWTQIEQFTPWHNIALATRANGLEGADAVLEFNNPIVVNHIGTLAAEQKDKKFDYGGRTREPEGEFLNGECGMIQTSSGAFGIFKAGAKFDFGIAELPYYPDVTGAPQNSIIGGASLWVMGRQETRGIQGSGEVLHVPVADGSAAGSCMR
jgi:sn-glycerol 3-phosphate transport system substrate-binding protein